ncbi:MAG: ABC-F family ATP-binding cassette domain-containing protein [Kiritimatiellae bacterium]|nr:ABC-F family ATP-binding cassette domain-containing protein [Kiritimatiellia bacterium]
MIAFQDVAVSFGTQAVLRGVTVKVNARERIGLVGPNGAGKTTFLNLLTGELSPDHGEVLFEGPRPVIGYLHQQLDKWDDADTLLSYTVRVSRDLAAMEDEIARLEAAMPSLPPGSPERARALARVGDLQTKFEARGGYDVEARAKAALCGLGFRPDDLTRPFAEFSGGWKMRAELVRTLVGNPDVLLLDEPSNYLDLPAVEWMQKFLREFRGTLLLVSHDRYLLRTLTTTTFEVDGETVTRYNGDYDFYLRERRARYDTLLAAKRNQDRIREQHQRFIDEFRSQANKASLVQSRVKMLEKMEPIVVPRQASAAGKLRIPPFHHCGTTALSVRDAGFSYDGARFVFRHVSFDVMTGEHVAIVGFNGLGKTTMSRLFAGVRSPTEGEVVLGHKVVPGYMSQEFAETIPPDRSLLNVVRREDETMTEAQGRQLLGAFGFSGDDAFKTAGVLSGGEKIRLAFARIYAAKPNFLILDEPTTHLDVNGRRALEEALVGWPGAIVVVSHDVEFVRHVAQNVVEVTENGVRKIVGTYDDYRERLAREAAAAAEARAAAPAAPNPNSKKEQRKARAAERERNAPLVRSLRRRVEATEARIAKLEEEQKALAESLAVPAPDADPAAVSRRLADIDKELATLTTLWEQAASELAFHEAE